jgi:hypothetical protein
MDMKRFFLYAIAIAALALAGCGGGGGGGTAMMPGDGDGMMPGDGDGTMPPVTPDPCPEGQERPADGGDCAPVTPSGPMMVDHMAIVGGIVAPMVAGDPSTAQGVNLVSRPGNAADNTEMVSARPGNSATDLTAALLIGDPDGTQDELNKDDMDTVDGEMMSRENQFMPVADSETMLGHFAGMVHEKTVDKVTDTVAVYTNMAAPGALTFAAYYETQDRAGVDGIASTDMMTLGRLTIDESEVEANSNLFHSAAFPSAPSQTFMYVDDDEETMDVDEEMYGGQTLAGRFNGVEGEYKCPESGACTASTDSDGDLMTLSDGWTFTPTAKPDEIMIMGVEQDADFMSFGYWVRATETDEGTTYGVGTFATGSQPFILSNARTREGTANYAGPSAGMYGKKTFNSNGTVASLTTGHFTADAKLEANFGGDDVAANKQFTISGTVGNFRDGSDMVDAAWEVELMKAGFAASGDNVVADLATDTFGGGTTGKGDWQGQFFGPATGPDGPDQDTQPDDILPGGVAGEYTGHFANGHVIGAFGATKQ